MTVPQVPTETLTSATAVEVPAWAWALSGLALGVVYLVLQDNGAVLGPAAMWLHEFTHDGRHVLGAPCH